MAGTEKEIAQLKQEIHEWEDGIKCCSRAMAASDEIATLEACIAAAREILDGAPYSHTVTGAIAALEGTK